MANSPENKDPLDFLKSMWSSVGFTIPGMVTPTLDVDELGKRIADMKAVEGWLKMNLNTLQMTIQGLEIQRATLSALQAMSQATAEKAAELKSGLGQTQSKQSESAEPATTPFPGMNFNPALWPWNFAQTQSDETPPAPERKTASSRPRKKTGE